MGESFKLLLWGLSPWRGDAGEAELVADHVDQWRKILAKVLRGLANQAIPSVVSHFVKLEMHPFIMWVGTGLRTASFITCFFLARIIFLCLILGLEEWRALEFSI